MGVSRTVLIFQVAEGKGTVGQRFTIRDIGPPSGTCEKCFLVQGTKSYWDRKILLER